MIAQDLVPNVANVNVEKLVKTNTMHASADRHKPEVNSNFANGYTNMALPDTIHEVIQRLEQIVEDCVKTDAREGYFAALYLRVTRQVSKKIDERYFDDNARMERLDVVFANRCLAAYDQYRQQQPCSASWQLAFDTCHRWPPLVLQHLLMGMNAHIGLDLGIAAATVCPGKAIEALHSDFNKINEILASLVNTVQDEIAQIWPLLKPIDWLAGKLDEEIAVFSMDMARDAAWKVALDYAALTTEADQETYRNTRDAIVAAFGKKIAHPGWIISIVIGVLRAFERGDVKSKIEALSEVA